MEIRLKEVRRNYSYVSNHRSPDCHVVFHGREQFNVRDYQR